MEILIWDFEWIYIYIYSPKGNLTLSISLMMSFLYSRMGEMEFQEYGIES